MLTIRPHETSFVLLFSVLHLGACSGEPGSSAGGSNHQSTGGTTQVGDPDSGGQVSTGNSSQVSGADAGGQVATSRRSSCVEGRFEAEVAGKGGMPRRPLWVNEARLHVVHTDRNLGLVVRSFAKATRLEIAKQSAQVFPSNLSPANWGITGVAQNPQKETVIAFHYMLNGVSSEGIALWRGEQQSTLTLPWFSAPVIWGLGWDGQGFTVSLVDSNMTWYAARISPDGELLSDRKVFGQASSMYGEYDIETDPVTGTTVFVTGTLPGVSVVGRRGLDTSLTSPLDAWAITGGDKTYGTYGPAVALHGSTALVAWADVDHGIFAREVSLDDGRASEPVLVPFTLPSIFTQVAAAWVQDHWVVVGQDYSGLVLAHIRGSSVTQRRLFEHGPAACSKTNSCGITSGWRWSAIHLSIAADDNEAWVGVVDDTKSRVQGGVQLFTYRILSTRDECNYVSLADE